MDAIAYQIRLMSPHLLSRLPMTAWQTIERVEKIPQPTVDAAWSHGLAECQIKHFFPWNDTEFQKHFSTWNHYVSTGFEGFSEHRA